MTQKDLLYVEDAYNHENSIINICNNIANNLDDEKLSDFINKEIIKHETMKEKLINLLEVKANE